MRPADTLLPRSPRSAYYICYFLKRYQFDYYNAQSKACLS